MELNRHFTVTPETGGFIHALDALDKARGVFYDALAQQYGDDCVDDIMEKTYPEWDAVQNKIAEFLTTSIVLNLAPIHKLTDDISI